MRILLPTSKSKTQFYINQSYVKYLTENKLLPILVNQDMNTEHIKELEDYCDGLLLPGGVDIDPIYYGYDNIECYKTSPQKDEFERNLLRNFIDKEKPVFGICRGFQLILRELKFAFPDEVPFIFNQHIPYHNICNDNNIDRSIKSHFVFKVNAKSKMFDDVEDFISVNSIHHQGLKCKRGNYKTNVVSVEMVSKLGLGKDKESFVIEAFSSDTLNLFGVQWHPEELKNDELVGKFFNQEN